MEFDPTIWRRKSIRLKGHDYAQSGAYFFTTCVEGRECRFGEIIQSTLVLSSAGEMIWATWNSLATRFPDVTFDEFGVMPNHVHGIVSLGLTVGAGLVPAREDSADPQKATSLADIVRVFKSVTTDTYMKSVKNGLFPAFYKRLWQRNYYESILRDDIELAKARQYIQDNPMRWDEDEENPHKH